MSQRRLWRKLGDVLAGMAMNTGTQMAGKDTFGSNIMLPPNDVPTLADIGISTGELQCAVLAGTVCNFYTE